MQKIRSVAIVVPVHTAEPSDQELMSFSRCCEILGKHPIFILHPEGLNLKEYQKLVPGIKTVSIDPFWQSSLKNYNRLKCSAFFYQLFADYEYVLTYELDAFVFNDELESWCSKEYSFIGAPWFEGFTAPVFPYKFREGGNSGFSLRNVQTCLKALKDIQKLRRMNRFYSKLNLNIFCSFTRFMKSSFLYRAFSMKTTTYISRLVSSKQVNEDVFWTILVGNTYNYFRVAPTEEAIKFSFEVNPQILYKMNNERLPFGCHAWFKYDYEFWQPWIN